MKPHKIRLEYHRNFDNSHKYYELHIKPVGDTFVVITQYGRCAGYGLAHTAQVNKNTFHREYEARNFFYLAAEKKQNKGYKIVFEGPLNGLDRVLDEI